MIVAPDMTAFLNSRIHIVRGAVTPGCPTSGPENETIVPTPSVCTGALNYGSMRLLTRAGSGSVRVAVVPAVHTNAIPAQYLEGPALQTGVAASAGPPVGYVALSVAVPAARTWRWVEEGAESTASRRSSFNGID